MKTIRVICFLIIVLTHAVYGQDSAPPFVVPTSEQESINQISKPTTQSEAASHRIDELNRTEESGMGRFLTEMFHMLFTLGLIIGAMLIGAWVLKKFLNTRVRQMNMTSAIKILERRTLTPKSAIYLIDVCGKGIVIAESPSGIERLTEIDLPPEVEENSKEEKGNSTFGQILKGKMNS
jgi:flagellar protein FliO/FliZ